MVLDKKTIEMAAHNFVWTEESEDGLLYFRRFTPSQMDVYSEDIMFCMMSRCQTGIYLLFQTTGDNIKLVLKKTSVLKMLPTILKELGIPKLVEMGIDLKEQIQQYGDGRLYIDDAFDIFVDDVLVSSPKPKSGKIKVTFENPEHQLKTIKICFPVFAEIGIKEISGNGEISYAQVEKGKIYSFGDSITQGFIAGSPSCSYVARLAEKLNMDALNQGVGGYFFNSDSLESIEELPAPKLITVAYGTNDWDLVSETISFREKVNEYFKKLTDVFCGIPKFVITPIWRGDMEVRASSGSFTDIIDIIKESAANYEDIYIIDGLSISPHEKEYYADGWLHPNSEGFKIMAEGIYENILKSKIIY